MWPEQRVHVVVVIDDANLKENAMSNTNERTPRTLLIGNTAIQVEELAERLPFARKPADLSQVRGQEYVEVYITETKELTATEFDNFASSLLVSRDRLRGKGGGRLGSYFCIEVTAPGRPTLYVNPEGSDYARYVTRAD
ncbi:hypothetical protein A3768_5364 (plasmid) [Ralstonia solanacearum]|nr:hypothetical protein A3768_5364 [Ralstonia solanacearum]